MVLEQRTAPTGDACCWRTGTALLFIIWVFYHHVDVNHCPQSSVKTACVLCVVQCPLVNSCSWGGRSLFQGWKNVNMNLETRKICCVRCNIIRLEKVQQHPTHSSCVIVFDTCVRSLAVNESSVCLQKKHAMLLCQLLPLQSSCGN